MNSKDIQKEVQRELQRSEVFISWAQLGFSLFILSFWIISLFARKSAPDFEVLPFMLGPYIVLSIIKVFLSYRKLIGEKLLLFSIFLDILLLSTIMWSFHIQYGQVPGLYLKAPTFIYYFFFIALRALRYEVSYVVLTGVASMISWLTLLGYALIDYDSILTRSFIEYTSSHKILIGAEIEKILGLIVVTVISAIAVYRKNQLLLKSTEDSLTKKNMTKFFSKDVARNISTGSEALKAGNGVIREAAILMIDLRSFTKITDGWDPQKILCVISDYQETVVPIIVKHGGSIDKYMGDGIFAHFGASSESKTYASDLIKAMQEIILACENWTKDRESKSLTPIKIGLAGEVGPIIFGTTGSSTRLEYTTIGSAVNNCAKLEKHTKELKVKSLISLETYELAQIQGLNSSREFKIFKEQKVDGMIETIDLVSLD